MEEYLCLPDDLSILRGKGLTMTFWRTTLKNRYKSLIHAPEYTFGQLRKTACRTEDRFQNPVQEEDILR